MYVIRNTMWVWQVLIARFYLKNQREKQLSPERFSLLLLRNTFWSRWAGQGRGETASLIRVSRKNVLRTASVRCESTLVVYKYAAHKKEHDLKSFDETYTFITSQFLGAVLVRATEATCVIKHTRIKNVIWQKEEKKNRYADCLVMHSYIIV